METGNFWDRLSEKNGHLVSQGRSTAPQRMCLWLWGCKDPQLACDSAGPSHYPTKASLILSGPSFLCWVSLSWQSIDHHAGFLMTPWLPQATGSLPSISVTRVRPLSLSPFLVSPRPLWIVHCCSQASLNTDSTLPNQLHPVHCLAPGLVPHHLLPYWAGTLLWET